MASNHYSKFLVENVLSKDEIYCALTRELGSRRYSRVRGMPVEELKKWQPSGQLRRDEREYLELFEVWKSRLDHLRIDYLNSCFSL